MSNLTKLQPDSEATNLVYQPATAPSGFRVQAMSHVKSNSSGLLREESIDSIAELVMSAEREIGAFYSAVRELYGREQADWALQNWLNEVEVADWPEDGQMPDWHRFTITAATKLAERVASFGPHLEPMEAIQ